jgi:uncharacterized protein with HEPN domain
LTSDHVYLIHISECIARVRSYVAGGRDRFMSDTMIQDAVLHNLQTLAESTQRLSNQIKATRPDVPWKDLSDFRNVMVHGYTGVDLTEVWGIIEKDLDPLDAAIVAMARSDGVTSL